MSIERVRRMRAVVDQLAPLARRDPDHWGEALDLAQDRLRRAISTTYTKTFWHDVATARSRHLSLHKTHVIVGDDPPELRRAS